MVRSLRETRPAVLYRFARASWLFVAVLILVMNTAGLALGFHEAGAPCLAEPCQRWQLTPGDAQLLAELDISRRVFSFAVLVFDSLITLNWIVIALALFASRSEEWVVLLGSLALLLVGSAVFGPAGELGAWQIPLLSWLSLRLQPFARMFLAFFYLFPDGRFVPRWSGWVSAAWVLLNLPALIRPEYDFLSSSWGVSVLMLFTGGIIIAQVYRYRRASNPLRRQQTKWAVFGIGVGFSGLILIFGILVPAFPALDRPVFGFDTLLTPLAVLLIQFIPVSFGIALLRYRLWDIDFIIRRTLMYGILSAILALLYLGGVVVFQQIFRGLTGQESPVVIVLTTLIIAALFNPLRRRLQELIDRRFYRSKYDARRTLETFSAAARHEVNLDRLSDLMLATVGDTLEPHHTSLWLRGCESAKMRGSESTSSRNTFRNVS